MFDLLLRPSTWVSYTEARKDRLRCIRHSKYESKSLILGFFSFDSRLNRKGLLNNLELALKAVAAHSNPNSAMHSNDYTMHSNDYTI